MTVLPIVRLGHPALRAISQPVSSEDLASHEMQTFLRDLADTCIDGNGVGIAAPQVAVNKRIIVVNIQPNNPRYPDQVPFPLTVVVNPVVVSSSDELRHRWEGDLSSNLRGVVPRPASCVIEGLAPDGMAVRYELVDDFHARVFLHEIDHLDGCFLSIELSGKKLFVRFPSGKCTGWKDLPLDQRTGLGPVPNGVQVGSHDVGDGIQPG